MSESEVKMTIYKENITKIADFLQKRFYSSEDFHQSCEVEIDEVATQRCLEKAEKLYKFFDDVQEIKKMLNFLDTVNPNIARELVDGL